jgi:hypothetical protein
MRRTLLKRTNNGAGSEGLAEKPSKFGLNAISQFTRTKKMDEVGFEPTALVRGNLRQQLLITFTK